MQHLRRLVWYIATRLILICVICGILLCAFFMCLNTANVYVVLQEGMEQRVQVILTESDAESLNFYFHADFLAGDPALEGAFDGSSIYDAYKISDFEYEQTIERIWAWPWDDYASCTIVERVSSITGTVKSEWRGQVSETLPAWQGGRYNVTLVKVDGVWKINGLQQTAVIM